MKHTLLAGLLLSLAALDASAQPSAPPNPEPQGDVGQVRSCDAIIATYPPMSHDPDHPCADMACASGFSVDASAVGRGPGMYRVEVVADGQSFSCALRLPFTSCDQGDVCTWTQRGTHRRISVTRSGCALPAAQHALTAVEFEGVCPAHVRVRMLRDGVEVGRYDSDVRYRRVVANGEGCGPVCAQGAFSARPTLRR